MTTLRPYQRRDANVILAHLHKGRSPIYQLPTRGGKTKVACAVIKTVIAAAWEVGFFVHRVELLRQACRAMRSAGIPFGVIAPGHGLTSHPVHVASIDTVIARLAAGDKELAAWVLRIRLMVPDEAHHFPSEKWQRVREMALHVLIFGMSATPYRTDGHGLADAGFNAVVKGPGMRELQALGFLAQFEVYAPPQIIDLTKLRLRGADFAKEEMQALVDNPDFVMMAARAYAKFAAGESCVVFGAGVQHAEHMAEGFRRAGWTALSIDSDTDGGVREDSLKDLEANRLHALCSCDLISEGVDLPAVAAAILGRPTWSTQLYQQQAGRPLTPHADKGVSRLIDLVGNVARHGMPDADRPWTLEGGVKGLERQVEPTRRCIRCWRVHEWAECCLGCGLLYPKHKGAPEAVWHLPSVAGMRPEVAASKTVGDLVAAARSREDLQRVARMKGLDSKWVERMTGHIAGRMAAE